MLRLPVRSLNPNEQEHSQNFTSDTIGTTFMLARACPRLVLSSYSSIPASRLRLAYSSYAKRMIDDPRSKLLFKVSHSGTRSPCLRISCGCEVGIGIEQVGRFLTLCRSRPALRHRRSTCWVDTLVGQTREAVAESTAGQLDAVERPIASAASSGGRGRLQLVPTAPDGIGKG
jgi:phosphopantetheinyl transferase